MIKVQPNVTILFGDKHGSVVQKYKNNMLQSGFDWLINFINNISTDTVSYIAIGDSDIPVSLGDMTLHNELFRKAISTNTKYDGNAYVEVFIDNAEANFTWKEIGLFAGGTSAKDSGTLIARAVIFEQKDNKRTANIAWEIGFTNL